MDGVVRTQTTPLGGDSLIVSSSNGVTTDSAIGGVGRIELGRSGYLGGTAEDLEIRGTEVASGVAPLHTHAGLIRVVDDGTAALDGTIRSQRHNDSTITARVAVSNVVLAPNAGVQLTATNAIPMTVDTITLEGNGQIDTAVAGITINNIVAGANTLNLTGAVAPTIVNSVTAGTANVARGAFNGALTLSNQLNVTNGAATFAGDVTASQVNVLGSTATFGGNLSSGLALTGSTVTVNAGSGNVRTIGGNVSLDAASALVVSSGSLDLGTKLITSTSSGSMEVAGLREQKITGAAFDENTANISNIIKLGPVMAQATATTGWGLNETYIYTGQFFVPNNNNDGTGSFAFAESFDDSVKIVIDGVQRLRNPTYNDSTGTGALTLATGWHDIEFRLGQGVGGAGPVNADGWNGTLGLGIDLDPSNGIDNSTTSPIQAQYVVPVDNGSKNLFRATVSNTVSLGTNASLRAAGMTSVGAVNFTGIGGMLSLFNASGSPMASSTGALSVAGNGSGTLEVAAPGDNLTIESLNLGGALTVTGEGAVTVTGAGTGTGALMVPAHPRVLKIMSTPRRHRDPEYAASVSTGTGRRR